MQKCICSTLTLKNHKYGRKFSFSFLFLKIENDEQICKYPKVLYCNCIDEVGEKHMLE